MTVEEIELFSPANTPRLVEIGKVISVEFFDVFGGKSAGNISPGEGIDFVTNEVPTGVINGTNATYTTAQSFRTIDLEVFLNGLRQRYAIDYTIPNSSTFVMTSAPLTGDKLIVDYIPL
jgi:hypothetical protein